MNRPMYFVGKTEYGRDDNEMREVKVIPLAEQEPLRGTDHKVMRKHRTHRNGLHPDQTTRLFRCDECHNLTTHKGLCPECKITTLEEMRDAILLNEDWEEL